MEHIANFFCNPNKETIYEESIDQCESVGVGNVLFIQRQISSMANPQNVRELKLHKTGR